MLHATVPLTSLLSRGRVVSFVSVSIIARGAGAMVLATIITSFRVTVAHSLEISVALIKGSFRFETGFPISTRASIRCQDLQTKIIIKVLSYGSPILEELDLAEDCVSPSLFLLNRAIYGHNDLLSIGVIL